jgi:signal transduction histidine kinase
MVIISHTMPGSMPGMGHGFGDVISEAIMAHHLGMSLYFTLLGASFGFLAGILYARILRQTEELAQQKRIIEEMLAEKDTLLRVLSHDLSNQICASSGFAELLSEHEGLNEDAQSMVGSIRVSLDLAAKLIEFSKTLIGIESGKISFVLVVRDVRQVISELLPTFKTVMEKKGLSFTTISGDKPTFVPIEPNIFCHSIMSNLISNAIKFSNPNQTIGVSISQEGGEVRISVSNDGPGMTKAKIETLFSIKNKTTTPGTMGEIGTGLGLPLDFKFVKLMHGEISVSSKTSLNNPRVSTTEFVLSFPSANHELSNGFSEEPNANSFSQPAPLVLTALTALPHQLIQRMRQAVADGDMALLAELITQVEKSDRGAAKNLRRLASRYDYEKLTEWLGKNGKNNG